MIWILWIQPSPHYALHYVTPNRLLFVPLLFNNLYFTEIAAQNESDDEVNEKTHRGNVFIFSNSLSIICAKWLHSAHIENNNNNSTENGVLCSRLM